MGAEEAGAFYTRDTAIMMPAKPTDTADGELLKKTIAHELFHILSRSNLELREKLYALIGFSNCGEIEFPDELKPRKITNPDAPRNDHAIRVQANGTEVSIVPILFSSAPNYDPVRDGEFFNYLQLGFLIVSKNPGTRADLLSPQQVSGFFEQVGRNTDYIIHPEEILAENFALLMIGRRDVVRTEQREPIVRIVETLPSAELNTGLGKDCQLLSCLRLRDRRHRRPRGRIPRLPDREARRYSAPPRR